RGAIMPMRCEIVSQDRSVFSGEADMVVLPGTEGVMGILPRHSPVLSTLNYGLIRVRYKDTEQIFTVAGGVVEVLPDRVTILADAAENVQEIDIQRAETARQRAEELLRQAADDPKMSEKFLEVEAALRRSTLRLNAARRFGRVSGRDKND
ncbi:MAG TPA: ATP synthase F1 subunit epsilon, partial [Anaerolineaceae bacterium]|nr:ATP synthase F1 subunit epsilon [Anaerolineaceae bacterium]